MTFKRILTSKGAPEVNEGRRVLVCLLPGLGDAIAASPMIRSLYESGAVVEVLTMLGAVSAYAASLEVVSVVHRAPLLSTPLRALPKLLRLRRLDYDEVYVPFPATRWQYAFVGRLLARRTLVIHDYGGLSAAIARTGAVRLIALRGGHRAYENLRLYSDNTNTGIHSYEMPGDWRRQQHGDLLGVHFGTMVYKNNEARRWPLQNFVEVVKAQLECGRRVRLFVGPSERQDAAAFAQFKRVDRFEIVDATLDEAARRVAECRVFLANDSGFAHLAAGVGSRIITLFGMTNPIRAQPIGASLALRPSACPPCHDEGLGTFSCVRNLAFRCTREDLPVHIVLDAIEQAFIKGLPAWSPEQLSNFQLYGRLHLGE